MFHLDRGYANRDRAQDKNKSAWLTTDLGRHLRHHQATPVPTWAGRCPVQSGAIAVSCTGCA
ncbi:MAG TPA: hypothetical protein V6C57_05450 [Coleofasciculaceae cyanobacterium]